MLFVIYINYYEGSTMYTKKILKHGALPILLSFVGGPAVCVALEPVTIVFGSVVVGAAGLFGYKLGTDSQKKSPAEIAAQASRTFNQENARYTPLFHLSEQPADEAREAMIKRGFDENAVHEIQSSLSQLTTQRTLVNDCNRKEKDATQQAELPQLAERLGELISKLEKIEQTYQMNRSYIQAHLTAQKLGQKNGQALELYKKFEQSGSYYNRMSDKDVQQKAIQLAQARCGNSDYPLARCVKEWDTDITTAFGLEERALREQYTQCVDTAQNTKKVLTRFTELVLSSTAYQQEQAQRQCSTQKKEEAAAAQRVKNNYDREQRKQDRLVKQQAIVVEQAKTDAIRRQTQVAESATKAAIGLLENKERPLRELQRKYRVIENCNNQLFKEKDEQTKIINKFKAKLSQCNRKSKELVERLKQYQAPRPPACVPGYNNNGQQEGPPRRVEPTAPSEEMLKDETQPGSRPRTDGPPRS